MTLHPGRIILRQLLHLMIEMITFFYFRSFANADKKCAAFQITRQRY
jgi:hypothetical protein